MLVDYSSLLVGVESAYHTTDGQGQSNHSGTSDTSKSFSLSYKIRKILKLIHVFYRCSILYMYSYFIGAYFFITFAELDTSTLFPLLGHFVWFRTTPPKNKFQRTSGSNLYYPRKWSICFNKTQPEFHQLLN